MYSVEFIDVTVCSNCKHPYDHTTKYFAKGFQYARFLHQIVKCKYCNFIQSWDSALVLEHNASLTEEAS